MQSASFRFPTDIRFGPGMASRIPDFLKEAGVSKPLLVTDKGLSPLPVCQNLIKTLKDSGFKVSVYDEAAGNPVESHVIKGTEAYAGSDADSLVLLGGGCALDVGKAIGLMAHHPGTLFDYEDDMPGARPVDSHIPYMLAVPTTAGTGSEVGGSSVISREEDHAKVIIWSGRLIPRLVVADPQLTVSLPAGVTAATGIDALTHNIEAFLARNYHPMCDGIALEGIRLIFNSLVTAVTEPDNLAARGEMLLASMMGATAFQKGLGVTHSCAHALSTCFDMHHGLANGMMLIPSMNFNFRSVPEKFARMGQAVGIFKESLESTGRAFISDLSSLKDNAGIPSSFRDTGASLTERLVDVAFGDACHINNPAPCSRDDIAGIFREAFSGS